MISKRYLSESPSGKGNSVLGGLLFILSPVLAVFTAFKNHQTAWARNIVWLFVGFYGYTMVISNERMDAASYRDELLRIRSTDMSLSYFKYTLYNPVYGELDVVSQSITYLVAQFTSNYHVLFAVYGLVFGFFYSRNIWYLLEKTTGRIPIYAWIWIAIFAFVIGFWNINGFRFWCAAHVFFYGAMPFVFERKLHRIWAVFAALLFHFSIFIPLIILLIYALLKNRVHLYFFGYIITFFINSIDLVVIGQMLQRFMPGLLEDKTKAYTNPEYAGTLAEEMQNMNVYAQLFPQMMQWIILLFFIYLYAVGVKKMPRDSSQFHVFNFSLLFAGVANLLSLVPSGGRFEVIGSLFAVALIYWFLQRSDMDKRLRYVLYVSAPLQFLYMVISVRLAMDTIGVMTLVGNPITMFFTREDWALIQLLK